MAFWFFMLLVTLILPVTMIVIGRQYRSHPPKNINAGSGYRTTMSMKNKDTWAYAHGFIGRLWFWGGIVLAPVSVAAMAFVAGMSVNRTGLAALLVCGVQLVLLIGSIIPTERALRRKFESNGKRRGQ